MENGVCWVCDCQLHEESCYINPIQSQNIFTLVLCMEVFLGNIPDWIVKDSGYMYCNAKTYSTNLNVTTLEWGRMMDSAAISSWGNYCVAGEHIHRVNLLVSNCIKIANFLWNFCQWIRIPDAWILDNWELIICWKKGWLSWKWWMCKICIFLSCYPTTLSALRLL
jgi:hypothetical protein